MKKGALEDLFELEQLDSYRKNSPRKIDLSLSINQNSAHILP